MVRPHRPSPVCQCVLFLSLSFTFASSAIIYPNETFLRLDGMTPMSDKSAIVFTRDFLEKPAHFSRTVPDRQRRQVIAGPWYQWGSNIVPFQIWGGDHAFQQLVRNGLRMWEEATCLRFQENTGSRDGIRYVLETGDACFTEYIGRSGGQQDIIIGSECAEGYVVAHETGHALGFWHTHQRPDREDHISINWKNVRDEAQASFMPFSNMLQAFDIRDTNSMRVPYDYGSLMHYHAVAHAKRVSDFTIVPRELKYVTTMGTERMSFLDGKVINDLYCSQVCSQSRRLRCLNGGYQDPNDCTRCRCPEGLGGRDCSQLQSSPCGQEIQATDQWQTLESPPGKDRDCYWRIKADGRVRFRLSDGEFPCSYGCQSYVEIKHKRDVRLTGFRSCCYRPKEDTVSDGDQIFVIYHPNGRTAHFSLRFRRD